MDNIDESKTKITIYQVRAEKNAYRTANQNVLAPNIIVDNIIRKRINKYTPYCIE